MGRLTVKFVQTALPGRHIDGEGLFLRVRPPSDAQAAAGAKAGDKYWFLRVQVDGKRHDIGLGAADTYPYRPGEYNPNHDIPILQRRHLTLADARAKARVLRIAAHAGLNPVVERDRERRGVPTFEEAAKSAHEALAGGWAEKNAAAFLASLTEHAYPRLGKLRVDQIAARDIRDTLEPIWLTKPQMARKVRQRIGTVLNFAKSNGWRQDEVPSRSVTVGLPRQPKGGHFDAMPYAEVPAFVASLRAAAQTTGRSALLFQILTAARPGEVRKATWEQIDLKSGDWNRPASIMKGTHPVPHTVTLNSAAIELLRQLGGANDPKPRGVIFKGPRGGMISDATMNKVIRDAGLIYDAHGFRSSFRDWAAEKMPLIPDPVAEAALAHAVPDAVIAAYRRTNFVAMRRELLEAWGQFILSDHAASAM